MSEYIIKTRCGIPNKKFEFLIDGDLQESKIWYDIGTPDEEGYRDSIWLELVYDFLIYNVKLSISEMSNINTDSAIELYKKLIIEKYELINTIVDVGAHHGQFTLAFSTMGNNIISIEPFFENYTYLETNIKLNNIKNVKCLNRFVSSTAKKMKFTHNDIHLFNNTYVNNFEIESIILDDLYDQIEFNPLIKIDTEGEEIQVLKGAQEIIKNKCPNFVIELHDFTKDNHDDILKIIDFGKYDVFKMNRRESSVKLYNSSDSFKDINWLFLRYKNL